MNFNLKDKIAIVTGGGGGIGRAICLALAREGTRVILVDSKKENLDRATQEVSTFKLSCNVFQADITKKTEVTAAINQVVAEHGTLHILVNNAGVAPSSYVEIMTEQTWDKNIDVNLKGTFLTNQAVIPVMKRQRWGRIINASSFAAIIPSAGFSAYAAAKAGVVAFTRVLAAELGPWNITANAYAPGMIPTELNKFSDAPDEMKKRLLNTLSIRRWGRAEDIANLILFLSSEHASYITGSHIDISGGKFAVQFPEAAYETALKDEKYHL